MKVVILAGGIGSRISEESHLRPKPMIEIGSAPILWHIMKIYSQFGLNDFVICLGYMGYAVREYFSNYILHNSDVTIDLKENQTDFHNLVREDWRVSLINTGEATQTGGRIARIRDYLPSNEPFCLTYGDGVADIDIPALLDFHSKGGFEATLTAVRPPGRFGALRLDGDLVASFEEKPVGDGGWINGGFFVVEPTVIDRIEDDTTIWEHEPLEGLSQEGKLGAYCHTGFWHPMDTLRDKRYLQELWDKNIAPWKTW